MPSVSDAVTGDTAPHCKAADPRCSICVKNHEETNHRCPVEGRKVGRGCLCPHGTVKRANCGGPHGARADACAAKREARGEARGWQSPPPACRGRGAAEVPEEPEIVATAAQGEEESEAEAEVVEEGESVQAAMEMEEYRAGGLCLLFSFLFLFFEGVRDCFVLSFVWRFWG